MLATRLRAIWSETACLGRISRYRVLLTWLRSLFSTAVCCQRVGHFERLLLPTTANDEPVFTCAHTRGHNGYVWTNDRWIYRTSIPEIIEFVSDF